MTRFWFFKKAIWGAEGLVQRWECFSVRTGEPESKFPAPTSKLGMATCVCNHRIRRCRSWELAGHHHSNSEFQAYWEILAQRIWWRAMEDSQWPLHVCTWVCMLVHIQACAAVISAIHTKKANLGLFLTREAFIHCHYCTFPLPLLCLSWLQSSHFPPCW